MFLCLFLTHTWNETSFWGCLVPKENKMQNTNYFEMMKYKMPKFSESCLVSSKMQNLLPS